MRDAHLRGHANAAHKRSARPLAGFRRLQPSLANRAAINANFPNRLLFSEI